MNIQGLGSTPVINIKDLNNFLKRLNIGDKLNVQVVGINNNDLILKIA
jgi:hypothetical protein